MAVRIDAATEYYSRDITGDTPDFTAGFSFAGWFQVNTDRNTYSSWFSIFGASHYLNIASEADGLAIWAFWNDAVGADNVSLFTATADTWYFVAGRKPSGATAALTYYFGAATAATFSSAATAGARGGITVTTLEIGRDGAAAEWLNGTSGPVKIWTAELSAAELVQESRQLAPVRSANLYAFYPFHSAADATARADFSGNGRNLSGGTGSTLVSGPPVPWQAGRRRSVYVPAAGGGGGATVPLPNNGPEGLAAVWQWVGIS